MRVDVRAWLESSKVTNLNIAKSEGCIIIARETMTTCEAKSGGFHGEVNECYGLHKNYDYQKQLMMCSTLNYCVLYVLCMRIYRLIL